MRLLLVRHGETQWNSQNRYQGHADVPLNDKGLQQARLLSHRLAKYDLQAIYSSDLQRAWATAQAIARAHSCPILAEPDLREMSFGVWQSLTYAEIQAQHPQSVQAWQADPLEHGPEGGENLNLLFERVCNALGKIKALHPEGTVLAVTHGGPIKMAVCQALGLSPGSGWQLLVSNASLSILEYYPEGAILTLFNDISHLDEESLAYRKWASSP
jgi:alpha-ribazole phosphatase